MSKMRGAKRRAAFREQAKQIARDNLKHTSYLARLGTLEDIKPMKQNSFVGAPSAKAANTKKYENIKIAYPVRTEIDIKEVEIKPFRKDNKESYDAARRMPVSEKEKKKKHNYYMGHIDSSAPIARDPTSPVGKGKSDSYRKAKKFGRFTRNPSEYKPSEPKPLHWTFAGKRKHTRKHWHIEDIK